MSSSSSQGYLPLSSVWEGGDAELLERMLDFYLPVSPTLVLDATVNSGRFWRGSSRPVVGMDIDPGCCPGVLGDNRRIPFRDGVFDAVVYDPPHVPDQGRDRRRDFRARFGLGEFSPGFLPFMQEARRVLRPGGVLFCKVADYVHVHRQHWAHVEVLQAGEEAGLLACDCIVKIRRGPVVDPRWRVASRQEAPLLLAAGLPQVPWGAEGFSDRAMRDGLVLTSIFTIMRRSRCLKEYLTQWEMSVIWRLLGCAWSSSGRTPASWMPIGTCGRMSIPTNGSWSLGNSLLASETRLRKPSWMLRPSGFPEPGLLLITCPAMRSR